MLEVVLDALQTALNWLHKTAGLTEGRISQVPLWVAQNRPPPPSWGEDHEL